MQRRLVVVLALAAVCATLSAAPAPAITIDPDLQVLLDAKHDPGAKNDGRLPMLLVFEMPLVDDPDLLAELDKMPPGKRRQALLAIIRKKAAKIQTHAMQIVQAAAGAGRATEPRLLYLAGALSFEASRDVALQLAALPDDAVLFHDRDIDLIRADRPADAGDPARATAFADEPFARGPSAKAFADTAWGVKHIGAPRVWDEFGLDGSGVLIGHIDTGADLDHPDLSGRLWVNPGEIAGNGLDDDGNGYVDDIHGWDFGDEDGAPDDDSPTGGHGTHTAGTVAGDGSGGTLTGVAPGATLMVTKVWRANGAGGTLGMIWAAEQYCVENGARILTMSLGFPGDIPAIYLRADRYNCENIRDLGVTFFNSAGNEHYQYDPPLELALTARVPAPWNGQGAPHSSTGGVITVGGTGYRNDSLYAYSSQGPADWGGVDPWYDWDFAEGQGLIKPDLALPGVNVNSTVRGGGYSGDTWSGTSMACPHAAGVAALMLQRNPSLSPAGIDSLLEKTAVDLGVPGKDNVYGAGRVDAYAAVAAVPTVLLPDIVTGDVVPNPGGDPVLAPGDETDLSIGLVNIGRAAAASDLTATLALAPNPWATVTDAAGSYPDLAADGGAADNRADPFRIAVTAGAPHGYPLTLLLTVKTPAGFSRTFDVPWYVGLPEWRTHDLGGVYLTVTDQGILGYLNQGGVEGDGFGFGGGDSHLFVGSFWAGTGADYVCSRDYDGLGEERFEWMPRAGEPTGRVQLLSGPEVGRPAADQVYRAAFDDAGHPAPRGLEVQQTSLAYAGAGRDGFVVLEYELHNGGASDLSGLYTGVYCDFDIGDGANLAGTDARRRMSYLFAADGPYCGIVLLGDGPPANVTAVNNVTYVYPTSAVKDDVKMALLTGSIKDAGGPTSTDWSTLVSTSLDLASGARDTVAFALVYGADLADLQAAADSAIAIYGADAPTDDDTPRTFVHLAQNQPNPFNPLTTIAYTVRQAGPVEIAVYDVAGRRVRTLVRANLPVGDYEVVWDGASGEGTPAPAGTYLYRMRGAAGTETRKMSLVR